MIDWFKKWQERRRVAAEFAAYILERRRAQQRLETCHAAAYLLRCRGDIRHVFEAYDTLCKGMWVTPTVGEVVDYVRWHDWKSDYDQDRANQVAQTVSEDIADLQAQAGEQVRKPFD